MNPITCSEQLMYNTIRLTSSNGDQGTGFFFDFEIGEKHFLTIITNKHVINNNPNETVSFKLHLKENETHKKTNIDIQFKTHWYFHKTKDLCFCFVQDLFNNVFEKTNQKVFYVSINKDFILPLDKYNDLNALEELVMIGYPIGLYDEINNFPIFRKGYTASHPAFDFNEENIGLIDMACFPGSSGSPIFILNENGYADKFGNHHFEKDRLIFLGILFSGPVLSVNGNIVISPIPTNCNLYSNTNIMTNLGYYIKANALDEFYELIQTLCNK